MNYGWRLGEKSSNRWNNHKFVISKGQIWKLLLLFQWFYCILWATERLEFGGHWKQPKKRVRRSSKNVIKHYKYSKCRHVEGPDLKVLYPCISFYCISWPTAIQHSRSGLGSGPKHASNKVRKPSKTKGRMLCLMSQTIWNFFQFSLLILESLILHNCWCSILLRFIKYSFIRWIPYLLHTIFAAFFLGLAATESKTIENAIDVQQKTITKTTWAQFRFILLMFLKQNRKSAKKALYIKQKRRYTNERTLGYKSANSAHSLQKSPLEP